MIPRRVFMFWDGPTKPDYVDRAMRSWEALHPDWDIIELNGTTGHPLMTRNGDLWDRMDEVSPKSNLWQYRTDLLRLEVLHDHGGIWVDADLEALRNVEPLVEGCAAFTSRETPQHVNNGFTGTIAGHAWYAEMLGVVRQRVLDHPEWRSNRQCGPGLFTDTIKGHPDVRVHPTRLIYPYGYQGLTAPMPESPDGLRAKFPDAYTHHFWHNKLSGGKRA